MVTADKPGRVAEYAVQEMVGKLSPDIFVVRIINGDLYVLGREKEYLLEYLDYEDVTTPFADYNRKIQFSLCSFIFYKCCRALVIFLRKIKLPDKELK